MERIVLVREGFAERWVGIIEPQPLQRCQQRAMAPATVYRPVSLAHRPPLRVCALSSATAFKTAINKAPSAPGDMYRSWQLRRSGATVHASIVLSDRRSARYKHLWLFRRSGPSWEAESYLGCAARVETLYVSQVIKEVSSSLTNSHVVV